jgi:DNA-binding LacI/PurR family transcriptional regulator
MAITIQQIARKVGVAPSTVSAALSDVCKKKISKVRIEQIRKIADAMGYTPNLSARRLRTGRTLNIGVVIPSFLGHHPISKYFDLVSQECIKRGYHAMPLAVERQYSEMSKYLGTLDDHHVDGLLFLDYIADGHDQYMQIWQSNRAMIFRMLDSMLASVPFDGVIVDHYNAGKKLIAHILSQGWGSPILVSEKYPPTRELGFWRAWKEYRCSAGLNPQNNEVVYQTRTAKCKYDAVKAFIDSGRVKKGETALLLDGGDGSSAVFGALSEAGLVVGKDIAVASTNIIPANEFVHPQMTVLSEPYEDIAKTMVELLLRNIENESLEISPAKSYEPQLVAGPSTCRQ